MITYLKFILYDMVFKTKFRVVLFLVGLLAIWQRSLKIHRIMEIFFGKYCLEVI